MLSLALSGCLWGCSGDPIADPPEESAPLSGTVVDSDGRVYPDVAVSLVVGGLTLETTTGHDGVYRFASAPNGDGALRIVPPLSMDVRAPLPISVLLGGDPVRTDVEVEARSLSPHVNVGPIDFLGEVRDSDSAPPTEAGTPLFARNVFDAPFGLLTPIRAPDGSPVTLADWEGACGEAGITCDRRSAEVTVDLRGLIPGGTYSFWLNFLSVPRAPGERVDFGSDVVRIEPLGSGTRNVKVADATGRIATSVGHSGCILTSEPALVMPVLYHIRGQTFGAAHIPDAEEVTHLLVYVR